MRAVTSEKKCLIMDKCIAELLYQVVAHDDFATFRTHISRTRVVREKMLETVCTVPIVFRVRACVAVVRGAFFGVYINHVFTRTCFTVRGRLGSVETEIRLFLSTRDA